jgi:hypothetical protein
MALEHVAEDFWGGSLASAVGLCDYPVVESIVE